VKNHDEALQRYLDGDMTAQEAVAFEREMNDAPELQHTAQALEQIGDVVRARYELAADDAGPKLAAMWDQLDRQLGAAPAVRQARQAKPGLVAAFRTWWESYRGHVLTGAVCAAAAALIVTFAVKPRVVTERVVVQVPVTSPVVPAVAHARPAEIESLEIYNGTSTIFQLPGATDDDTPMTVIWVTEPGPEGPI
jgi:hypothetical protein